MQQCLIKQLFSCHILLHSSRGLGLEMKLRFVEMNSMFVIYVSLNDNVWGGGMGSKSKLL